MKHSVLTFFMGCVFFFSAQSQTCNDWLSVPSAPSSVDIGDLDITGTQVTVEALINRTAPGLPGANYGDIVSKHSFPGDINYLLRPNRAEITTSNNGAVAAIAPCVIDTFAVYHVALVYDGATLTLYRNGIAIASQAASGNLALNNFNTKIGDYAAPGSEQFFGYINEVRIWNVARTQAEIQQYMSTSLPTPSLQPGLQAYYVFSSLTNLQGNTAWDGTLVGSAAIGATNPNCFFGDDCGTISCEDTCFWKVTGNTISGARNVFGTTSNSDIRFISNATSRGILQATGEWGLATMAPTTTLHVNAGVHPTAPSGIRFEKLPTNKGTIVVIDKSGYLYDSKVNIEDIIRSYERQVEENKALTSKIEELERRLNAIDRGNGSIKSTASLRLSPNPSNGTTQLTVNIPDMSSGGIVKVNSVDGRELNAFKVTKTGATTFTLEKGKYPAGLYLVTLIVDSKLVESQKLSLY